MLPGLLLREGLQDLLLIKICCRPLEEGVKFLFIYLIVLIFPLSVSKIKNDIFERWERESDYVVQ